MRKYHHIQLGDQSITTDELNGEEIIRVGRNFIAKTLLEQGVAKVDPLSPENPLIFSAGPFAGTNFSNANRLSVGCKSPLTGGIKEANAGGTFGYAMGQLEISGFTLYGASDEWVVIHIKKDGTFSFDTAEPFMGKNNIECGEMLFEKYGQKVSLGLCGPVGEYMGLVAGIAFTDPEGRPVRIAARGGVGAVMGSKKVKAIVVDRDKMPTFHDRKKVMGTVKEYGKRLNEDAGIEAFQKYGTAMVADFTNKVGGLPTRNFSEGQIHADKDSPFKLGGTYIRELNMERGGEPTHACMPGCQIQCSNIYVNEKGEEMVSPMEYETIGLMGSNCGLEHPDDVATVNYIANDLGVDTIEVGAAIGVMMDSDEGNFGDVQFMLDVMEDMRVGNERGRILASGTARAGEHYGVKRIPVVKKQGISAYDPREIEVTGISMMITAQGADHTTGNIPTFVCTDKTTLELAEASLGIQTNCAAADSLGICLFGRSVTDVSRDVIIEGLNDAHDVNLSADFFDELGLETLKLEWAFNKEAGFTEEDDELPEFFYTDAIEMTGKKARHHTKEVNEAFRTLLGV